jgi:hypothetical protein
VLTDERRRRGRRSRVVPTPRRWRQVLRRLQRSAARRWWQSSIGSPRRARSKPVNQPRREGRSVLAPTPVDFAPFARLFRARAHGCRRALGLPCALSLDEGAITLKARTRLRREEGFLRSRLFDKETCWSPVIAWGESDEAIDSVAAEGLLDCFAEPVIGPRFARTRWLAMTNLRRRPKA